MKKTFLFSCLALALVGGMTGCKPSGDQTAGGDTNEIKVGEYASLTGKEAAFGNLRIRGRCWRLKT